MEISDDFRKEVDIILKKWIKLLHDLDPKFMEMLKLQLDYKNRLETLRIFLRKEVGKEIEKAFHSEFPNEEFTSNVKKGFCRVIEGYTIINLSVKNFN